MATSPGFRDFVIEQLAGVRDLVPRRMFGGVGFYSDETFFALIIRDTAFFVSVLARWAVCKPMEQPVLYPFFQPCFTSSVESAL